MKKKILFALFAFVFGLNVHAITWQEVQTLSKTVAFIDVDSIKEHNNYYFFNIQVKNTSTNENVVITLQSAKNSAFAARIKAYTVAEYNSLQGDYENITNNMTENLEPTTYYSTAYACSKWVKYQKMRENTKITIE